MKRKTKKTGKRLCTASPEPVRRAAKSAERAEGERDEHREARTSTSTPAGPDGEFGAGDQADAEVDDRLHQAEHDHAAELAAEQRDPAHRRQREPVQEAGLDVAREVGAGVHRREQRALDERHGEGEGEERVRSGSRAGCVSALSPPELTASSNIGKSSGGTTLRRLAQRAHDRAPARAVRPGRAKRRSRRAPSPARRLSRLLLVAGALERAAGLGEEDVVERGLVELRCSIAIPLGVERAHDLGEVRLAAVRAARRRPSARRTSSPKRSSIAAMRSRSAGSAGIASTVGPPHLGLQRGRRALGDDLAVVDDPDPVGERRRPPPGTAWSGRRSRRPRSASRLTSLPERGAALDVEAGGRLVEEEDLAAGARARARGRAGASSRPSSRATLRSAASAQADARRAARRDALRPLGAAGCPAATACRRRCSRPVSSGSSAASCSAAPIVHAHLRRPA